ncbi:MAG: hypothetical protein HZB31_13155 [Nitrospirae bacterium]|nr:hypothetical protein [Nitrospirota bacterium]
MKIAAISGLLICFVLFMASNSFSAPLPRFEPVDLSGTISDVRWFPEKSVMGTPGMSGSAGKDRTFPAHFIVELNNAEGVDRETAGRLSYFVAGERSKGRKDSTMFLQLDHRDRNFLQKGMEIRIRGYTVRGDEGGTWTSYKKIEVLP